MQGQPLRLPYNKRRVEVTSPNENNRRIDFMEIKRPHFAADMQCVKSDAYSFTDEQRDKAILDLQVRILEAIKDNDRRRIESDESFAKKRITI